MLEHCCSTGLTAVVEHWSNINELNFICRFSNLLSQLEGPGLYQVSNQCFAEKNQKSSIKCKLKGLKIQKVQTLQPVISLDQIDGNLNLWHHWVNFCPKNFQSKQSLNFKHYIIVIQFGLIDNLLKYETQYSDPLFTN